MKILKQFQVILITLYMLQLSSYQVISARSFEAMNYIEALLGASRGPLSALSFHKENKSKVLQSFTSVVRIAHEACAIINHKDENSYSLGIRGTWMVFDAINFYDTLFHQKQDEQDDQIDVSPNNEKIIDHLTKKSQLLLLPAIESVTALYQATNLEQTPQRSINQRRAQALCSLARATSIFLDNRQSKAALILLIATLNETMLAINQTAQPENQVNTIQENSEHNVVPEEQRPEIFAHQAPNEQAQDVHVQENQEPAGAPAAGAHEQVEELRPEIETLRTQITEQLEQIQLQLRQEQQAREEQLRQENEALRQQNELIANRYQRLEEAHHQAREQLNRIQENEARRARSAREARTRIETARQELHQVMEKSTQTLREAREVREESNRFLEQERITGELIDKDPDIQTLNEFDALIGANATIAQLQDFVNNIASK